jgi:hypothetical protein
MTKEQHALLITTIESVFGECKTRVDEDEMSIYVEARQAGVLVYSTVVEVESITGPMMVAGWEVGIINEDEEFEEECLTENFWEMASTVAEMIAEQIVLNIRAECVGTDDEEEE